MPCYIQQCGSLYRNIPSIFLRRNSNAKLDALSTVLSRVGLTLAALVLRRFRHKKRLNSVL